MTHPTLLILNSVTATAARLAIPLFVATLALVIALSMTAASNRHAAGRKMGNPHQRCKSGGAIAQIKFRKRDFPISLRKCFEAFLMIF